jgi:hypothetical protein
MLKPAIPCKFNNKKDVGNSYHVPVYPHPVYIPRQARFFPYHRRDMANLRKSFLAATLLSGACLSPAGAQQIQPAPAAAPQFAMVSNTRTPPIREEISELDGSPDVREPTGRLYLQPNQYGYGATVGERNIGRMLDTQGTMRFHSEKDDVDGGVLGYFHPLNLRTHIQETPLGEFTEAGTAGVAASIQYLNSLTRPDVRAQAKGVQTLSHIPHVTGFNLGKCTLFPGEFALAEKVSDGLQGPYFNVKTSAAVLDTKYAVGVLEYNEREGRGFDINADPPRGWSGTVWMKPEGFRELEKETKKLRSEIFNLVVE